MEERRVPVGDVAAAIRVIVDHYERVRRPGAADARPGGRRGADGRRSPRAGDGCTAPGSRDTFAPFLATSADPEALLDLLVVATDVYTWKLLRRDRGLSRDRTEQRMRALVDALLT